MAMPIRIAVWLKPVTFPRLTSSLATNKTCVEIIQCTLLKSFIKFSHCCSFKDRPMAHLSEERPLYLIQIMSNAVQIIKITGSRTKSLDLYWLGPGLSK